MIFWDWTLLILVPALLLSAFAQWKVKSTFAKYARVGSRGGYSGAEATSALARSEGVPVTIRAGQGYLSDHYNPADNSLVLSPEVYSGRSLSSLGVAAHELGHAIQKKEGYWPMYVRSGLVPVANIGTQFSWILLFAGILMGAEPLQTAGILLFSAFVLFTLITLPVEFDASYRALKLLRKHGLITEQETPAVKRVLSAAALTYVAAAVMAVAQLARLLLIARSDD